MGAEQDEKTSKRAGKAKAADKKPNYPVDTPMTSPSTCPNLNQSESVEITPAMIEAGLETLRASGAVENPLEADCLLVQAIFKSMLIRSSLSSFSTTTTA